MPPFDNAKGMTLEELQARKEQPRSQGYRVWFKRRVDDQRDPWDCDVFLPPLNVAGFPTAEQARVVMADLIEYATSDEKEHKVVYGHKLAVVSGSFSNLPD